MVALARRARDREHVMRSSRGQGPVGTTLRYHYEVREADAIFTEIPNLNIPKEWSNSPAISW